MDHFFRISIITVGFGVIGLMIGVFAYYDVQGAYAPVIGLAIGGLFGIYLGVWLGYADPPT